MLEFDASPLNTQPPSQWPRDLASWHGYIFGRHTILDSQSINPPYFPTRLRLAWHDAVVEHCPVIDPFPIQTWLQQLVFKYLWVYIPFEMSPSIKEIFTFSDLLHNHDRLSLSPSFHPLSPKHHHIAIKKEGAAAIAAMKLPLVNGMQAHNMTPSHATLVRHNTSPSTATPFPLPLQSGWGVGDIGTLIFGCIASVLGVLTLWAAYWQGCRRALRVVGNGAYVHRQT